MASNSERLKTNGGKSDLEFVDRTDEKSVDAAKITHDESILAHDLAKKN